MSVVQSSYYLLLLLAVGHRTISYLCYHSYILVSLTWPGEAKREVMNVKNIADLA